MRKPTKRRQQPEAALQRQVANYLRAALVEPAFFFAVPNGGKRSPIEAAIMRAMGVAPGVPDILITYPAPSTLHPVTPQILAVELKSARGKLSYDQQRKLGQFRAVGAFTAVCKSLVEVERACRDAGVPLRGRLA